MTGHEHDRHLREARRATKLETQLKTVDVRHEDIAEHDVRPFRLRGAQRVGSPACCGDGEAEMSELDPRELELHRVIDDEQMLSLPDHLRRFPPLGKVRADGVDQTTWLDRLHEQRRKRGVGGPALLEPAEEPREREDRQFRPAGERTQASNELEPVHVRQNQILKHEVGQGGLGRRQCRAGVRRLDHGVALGLEDDAQHLPRDGIVLDDEDRRGRHAPPP